MNLSRTQLAGVKAINRATKTQHSKINKLSEKIAKLEAERNTILEEVDAFESPIVGLYGFTSQEILDGALELVDNTSVEEEATSAGETSGEVLGEIDLESESIGTDSDNKKAVETVEDGEPNVAAENAGYFAL